MFKFDDVSGFEELLEVIKWSSFPDDESSFCLFIYS
jgi:hypothetical protein